MGNIFTFLTGFFAREIFDHMQDFPQEPDAEEIPAPREILAPPNEEILEENQIQEIDQNEVLAIEWPEINQRENLQNAQNISRYEASRAQWWDNFRNPVYRSTRSRYVQVSQNASEENHYQLM